MPFEIQSRRPPNKEFAEIRGNQVVFLKQLSGEDEVPVFIQGFGDDPKNAEFTIENRKVARV